MLRGHQGDTAGCQSEIIRKYKEGDEERILELRKLCLGSADLEEWTWEFKKSPWGSIIYIAECGGQIVGFYSLLPVKMKIGDKILTGSIVCDAMVHPEFRRKGVYFRLGEIAWEEAKKEGYSIAYAIAGEITSKYRSPRESFVVCRVPILVKFFDTHEEMRKRIKSKILADTLSILANSIIRVFYRTKKRPLAGDSLLTEIAEFDDRVNSFWLETSNLFKITPVRNKEYLNWRCFQRPNSNFKVLIVEEERRILGYIVLAVRTTAESKRGYIVDVAAHPDRPEIIQLLVSEAIHRLKKEKVNLIACWMMENSQYYETLRKNGFMRHWGGNLLAAANPSRVPEVFIRDASNWHITLIDSDGILFYDTVSSRWCSDE